MPRRPATSGYARLAQAEEEEEDEAAYTDDPDDEPQTISSNAHHYAAIQPGHSSRMQFPPGSPGARGKGKRRGLRRRTNSGVDIKAINARLEKWADEIASKFKRKGHGKGRGEEKLEIHHSVFQPPDGMASATADQLAGGLMEHADERITKMQFDDIVESVRVAIELDMHPKMNTKGSSGSYFARNSEGKVLGVFKPKDEEPYATKNPKWTKWIHRNLFPCFFGRACLIPNLSYVSEAAAYVLDTRLQTNIVPYTDIVYFSSISFNYDFWDRRAYYRKKKSLPPKVGSFQVFLKGFKDANIFLKEHPWPDQGRSGRLRSRSARPQSSTRSNNDNQRDQIGGADENDDGSRSRTSRAESRPASAYWSEELQQSLREELEKLVILDYIMRNTDRGLDNWMIRIDEATQTASIVAEPPRMESTKDEDDEEHLPATRKVERSPNEESRSSVPRSEVLLGAIDNSLSWPWKHPDAWRTFPFGWLFLPVSLIGQPFSEKTRKHFLPLLTSKQWWAETKSALRECFSQDSDFQERMFARQMAVMKGQAWNVVETLKTPEHGPLELTRRTRVCVWDDIVDVPTITPMRTPSSDIRRKHEVELRGTGGPEEMDISTIRPEEPQGRYPLNLGSASAGFPTPKRFDLSRHGSSEDVYRRREDSLTEIDALEGDPLDPAARLRQSLTLPRSRPKASRSKTNKSSVEESRSGTLSKHSRRRNFSFSTRLPGSLYDDEDEGDLGFSAAGVMEGNRKKVIVERLETVKSSIPVFTWC